MRLEYNALMRELFWEENAQWIREADAAIQAGDSALALYSIGKARDLALDKQYGALGGRRGWHVLHFGWYVALHGDEAIVGDLLTFAEKNAARSDASGEQWMLKDAQNLATDIVIYNQIRKAVKEVSGYAQAKLAKDLGVENARLAALASSLCWTGEVVAANQKGRIYLWDASDPAAPPESERRPVNTEYFAMEFAERGADTAHLPKNMTAAQWAAERESLRVTLFPTA